MSMDRRPVRRYGMTQVRWEVVDGKAVYDGRTLIEWVPEVVDCLVSGFAPLRVVLFGSVARGEDGPDSDIDLLVEVPELRGRPHDIAVAMLHALANIPAPVDIFPTDPADLLARGQLPGTLRVALREGRLVHGPPA